VVAADRETTQSPVVLAIDEPERGSSLLRSALDEAMGRSCELVVLDCGESGLQDWLRDRAEAGDREISGLHTSVCNPHVKIVPVEPETDALEHAVSYSESVQAGLLVIGTEQLPPTIERGLSDRIFAGEFDVLVVAEGSQSSDLADPGPMTNPARS
jgi:hypothetical protein